MAEYKFLDDLAKFGNSTMSAMGGFQKQASRWVAEQTASIIKGMDIVTKQEVENHIKKIAELEARIAKLEGKTEAKPAKTATPKAKKAE